MLIIFLKKCRGGGEIRAQKFSTELNFFSKTVYEKSLWMWRMYDQKSNLTDSSALLEV